MENYGVSAQAGGIVEYIRQLAESYAQRLAAQIALRKEEMAADDTGHYLVYEVLGISREEGAEIDDYQNRGRFLYRYAGGFLEDAAVACFVQRYPEGRSVDVPNAVGSSPQTFEIDCYIKELGAIEIKWRDATTDGDHIRKERDRLLSIEKAGFKPVRLMFYEPNREAAIRIQKNLASLYEEMRGEYHSGDSAWGYVKNHTGVDLKAILEAMAKERASGD